MGLQIEAENFFKRVEECRLQEWLSRMRAKRSMFGCPACGASDHWITECRHVLCPEKLRDGSNMGDDGRTSVRFLTLGESARQRFRVSTFSSKSFEPAEQDVGLARNVGLHPIDRGRPPSSSAETLMSHGCSTTEAMVAKMLDELLQMRSELRELKDLRAHA